VVVNRPDDCRSSGLRRRIDDDTVYPFVHVRPAKGAPGDALANPRHENSSWRCVSSQCA
jgi:hypothetical protein